MAKRRVLEARWQRKVEGPPVKKSRYALRVARRRALARRLGVGDMPMPLLRLYLAEDGD